MIQTRVTTLADLEALCQNVETLEAHLGFKAAEGGVLPPEFVQGWIEKVRARPEWIGVWAIEDGLIIGSGGFKGAPEDGWVEIGYGVAPSVEGRGVGTAICAALVEYAFAHGAEQVIAHTLHEGLASQRILEKNGFVPMGEVIDPEDGRVLRFSRVQT